MNGLSGRLGGGSAPWFDYWFWKISRSPEVWNWIISIPLLMSDRTLRGGGSYDFLDNISTKTPRFRFLRRVDKEFAVTSENKQSVGIGEICHIVDPSEKAVPFLAERFRFVTGCHSGFL